MSRAPVSAPVSFDAVRAGDATRVRALLDDGAGGRRGRGGGGGRRRYYNVNAEDAAGLTPLIEATLRGSADVVELLLARGARAQPAPGFRHTALRAACLTGHPGLIATLLAAGADPNARSDGGRTPLMGACYLRPQHDAAPDRGERSLGAVRAMLDDPRTDAGIENDFGETALELCLGRKYVKSADLLRERLAGAGGS